MPQEADFSHQKEDLLKNISEIFLTYGLRSTSMDDICYHLKISKKTLYQIFENKDDVVEQVMLYRRAQKRKENDLDKMLKMNPVHFLYSIKKHIISDLSSRLPANLYDMKKYHPEVDKRISQGDREFITQLLTKVLLKGVQDGYFQKDLNMELQIYLFSKQMSFLGDPDTMNTMEYPIPTILTTIIDNFIRAISCEKGIVEFNKLKEDDKKNGI